MENLFNFSLKVLESSELRLLIFEALNILGTLLVNNVKLLLLLLMLRLLLLMLYMTGGDILGSRCWLLL